MVTKSLVNYVLLLVVEGNYYCNGITIVANRTE